jgi:hypothetical protein
MILHVKVAIKEAFGIDLSATVLLKNPTIRTLAKYICDRSQIVSLNEIDDKRVTKQKSFIEDCKRRKLSIT